MGDFSVDDYYDRMGTNMFPVYPILLFIYLFLTTIFLVNLLIAQVWRAEQVSYLLSRGRRELVVIRKAARRAGCKPRASDSERGV